jgi:hypothetical protein
MGEIKYPITVRKIKYSEPVQTSYRRVGMWVKVRPCAEDCKGKTFLGVYLGDLTLSSLVLYYPKTKVLEVCPHQNPAIFVPDLGRIVWGCESWWGEVEGPEDLRQITDADIQNVWYVRALKELSKAGSPGTPPPPPASA